MTIVDIALILVTVLIVASFALIIYLIFDIIRMNQVSRRIRRELAKRRHPAFSRACKNCNAPLAVCDYYQPAIPCCGRCDHSKESHVR